MAPTAIDFPAARYYGYLNVESLRSILTHSGDTHTLDTIYRGWGLLPWAAQVLEKHLLLTHGWDWFTYAVAAQVLEHNEEETYSRVELSCQTPTGERQTYQAEIVADEGGTVAIQGSCASEKRSTVTPTGDKI